MTLSAYVVVFLARHRFVVRPSTLRSYANHLRLYVEPILGLVELAALTRTMVFDLLQSLQARDLARSTVRVTLCTLRTMLSAAVDEGLVPHNVTHRTGKHLRARDHAHTLAPLRPVELEQLLGALRIVAPPFADLALFMERTGLRIGETLGLRWDDIDYDTRTVVIERTWHDQGRLGPPKSGKARTIDLSPDALGALVRRQTLAAHGVPWVWASKWGTPYDRSFVHRCFRRACAHAKLTRAKFAPHSLRHTFGTELMERGGSLRYVQTMLGHSDPKVTGVYIREARLPSEVHLLDRPHHPPRQALRRVGKQVVGRRH